MILEAPNKVLQATAGFAFGFNANALGPPAPGALSLVGVSITFVALTMRRTARKWIWSGATLAAILVLYLLSFGPALWFFDTLHSPVGYMALPPTVRAFYRPIQSAHWPGFYCLYLLRSAAGFAREDESLLATQAERTEWPKTLDQAVGRLVAEMNESDKTLLRTTQKEDLIKFHHGWGTGIRNEFGLWKGNTNLMVACGAKEPDEASMAIIKEVWKELQKQ